MHPNKYLQSRPVIYGIRNLLNGKLYVGKTHCMYRRCAQYVHGFKKSRRDYINSYLMAAMTKAGISNFEMFVIEFCDSEQLSENELKWMHHFRTTEKSFGYNLRMDSSSGMRAHDDTKALQSSNLKKQWADGVRDDHAERLKESWVNASPERRRAQSERFRKSRTKFEYEIVSPSGVKETCDYRRLQALGIQSAVGNLWRNEIRHDKLTTLCKGFTVTRRPLGELA